MSRSPFRKLYALEERHRKFRFEKRWGPWCCLPAHVYTDLTAARNGKLTLEQTYPGMRQYGDEYQCRITHFVREKPKHMWQAMRWKEGKRS